MTTRDEARERLARIIDPSAFKTMREVAADNGLNVDAAPACVVFDESVDIPIGNRRSLRVAALTKADAILALLSPDAGGDQPRPSVSEDQGSSRDHALTDSVALDGEHFGPWRVWFDPPPIGTRECDWHYQHEDAEPECPAWMHGHCASRDACIAEIIDGYEERA